MRVDGHQVHFDATGIAAVRLDDAGHVLALAAGGLKYFSAGELEIRLKQPVDLALWIGKDGKWEGVVQGWKGDLPPELVRLTEDWTRLAMPEPYAGSRK